MKWEPLVRWNGDAAQYSIAVVGPFVVECGLGQGGRFWWMIRIADSGLARDVERGCASQSEAKAKAKEALANVLRAALAELEAP